jgi:hypothetical protein
MAWWLSSNRPGTFFPIGRKVFSARAAFRGVFFFFAFLSRRRGEIRCAGALIFHAARRLPPFFVRKPRKRPHPARLLLW